MERVGKETKKVEGWKMDLMNSGRDEMMIVWSHYQWYQ